MSNLVIKEIQEQDLQEMEFLYNQSIRLNSEGFIQNFDYHPNIKIQALDFKKDGGSVVVLKKDGNIIGMGALKREDEFTAQICKLHVSALEQGYGYGRKIIEYLINQAQEKTYKKIILHVTKSQQNAIAVYTKIGFKIYDEKLYEVDVFGTIEKYDSFLMELDLT